MRDKSRSKRSVSKELRLTTGEDKRARSCPKGDDSKLNGRDSSSVPVDVDVAPWVVAPLCVRARPFPLRDALCESRRANKSQKSVLVSCFFTASVDAGVLFFPSTSLSLFSSEIANGVRGRK